MIHLISSHFCSSLFFVARYVTCAFARHSFEKVFHLKLVAGLNNNKKKKELNVGYVRLLNGNLRCFQIKICFLLVLVFRLLLKSRQGTRQGETKRNRMERVELSRALVSFQFL